MSLVLEIGLLAVGLFFGYIARDMFKPKNEPVQAIQKKISVNTDLIEQKVADVERRMDHISKVLENIPEPGQEQKRIRKRSHEVR